MKHQAPTGPSDPILVDEAASTFPGGFGPGWTSRKRGRGTLVLTAESLTFLRDGEVVTAIPVDEIEGLAMARRHPLSGPGSPLLRVTYRGNLVLGVVVEQPQRWINAIEALNRHAGRAVRVEREVASGPDARSWKAIVFAFLVLILILSIALPLLFSWMQGRVQNPESGEPTSMVMEDAG